MSSTGSGPTRPVLVRELTLLDATMINIGSMIGSGIFLVPAMIAVLVDSSLLVLAVWIVAGIVSLFGAISIAELGAMMPEAGGQYVFLSRTFGRVWGYLYGWACFTVINTASIAAVAIVFATYLGYFFPLNATDIKIVAVASVVVLTVINCFGVKIGAIVQNGLTFIKIGALLALVALGFFLGGGATEAFSPFLPQAPWGTLWGPLALALVAALFAFDGWIEITFVSGEVRNPGRNVPRSIVLSTLIVIAIYLLLNYTLISVLSLAGVAASGMVVSDAAVRLMGPFGAMFVAGAVVVSTFGANNGFIFTCPRLYYAMAADGLFFRWMAQVSPRFHTPVRALVAQAVIVILLIITGTFDRLVTYVVFGSWGFYALSALAVLVLRRRWPDAPRPYRAWGYPLVQILFVLFATFLVVATIVEAPADALVGLGIIALGLPFYAFWQRRVRVDTA